VQIFERFLSAVQSVYSRSTYQSIAFVLHTACQLVHHGPCLTLRSTLPRTLHGLAWTRSIRISVNVSRLQRQPSFRNATKMQGSMLDGMADRETQRWKVLQQQQRQQQRTTNFELRTSNGERRTSNFELRTSNFELRTMNDERRTANDERTFRQTTEAATKESSSNTAT